MLVPEINENIINRIFKDQYKRVSGVFLINKPSGVTSHDVVDDVRKILRTRKVGHAGALDPFAEGLLIILVGKYTKYADAFISLDKSYMAGIVLGVSTETQDTEGELAESKEISDSEKIKLEDQASVQSILDESFRPTYEQRVPVFSSVKVNGDKLRVLARTALSIEKLGKGMVKFIFPNEKELVLELPTREVEINDITIRNIQELGSTLVNGDQEIKGAFLKYTVDVACSKGTYIRQLAEDIGQKLGYPSYLNELTRTSISSYSMQSAISLEMLHEQASSQRIQDKPLKELRLRTLT